MAYLDVDFFAGDTLEVARNLIGTLLVVGPCQGRIVETEAYTTDPASHAVTRRHTAAVMSHTHGHIYVYRIYGMHCCLNFTTERDGVGAVLIRALEPTRGLAHMIRRRGLADPRRLLSGPGRVCQALGIDMSLNGLPLGGRIKLKPRTGQPEIAVSRRVGIRQAAELEWRFYEVGNPFVSRPALAPGPA